MFAASVRKLSIASHTLRPLSAYRSASFGRYASSSGVGNDAVDSSSARCAVDHLYRAMVHRACTAYRRVVHGYVPILSFADDETEALFYGGRTRGVGAAAARQARLRLLALHAAPTLAALASPGADLKRIAGRKAVWQMRVNRQYRLRFVVVRDPPLEVEDVWFGDPH